MAPLEFIFFVEGFEENAGFCAVLVEERCWTDMCIPEREIFLFCEAERTGRGGEEAVGKSGERRTGGRDGEERECRGEFDEELTGRVTLGVIVLEEAGEDVFEEGAQ